MTTITRRIITSLAAPAIAAGFLAGGLLTGPPAQAQTGTASCVTARVTATSAQMLNPLTRPAQLANVRAPEQPVEAATSCLGH